MSDELNTGRPSVIVYETVSGVMVHITPLSIFTVQSIRDRAEKEFPYPDPDPYRMPLENAADPSIKLPAEDNPEYKAVCKPIDQERVDWRVLMTLELACAFPAFESREAMLAHYRPQLEKLRKATLMDGDEWQNVLNFCVFTGRGDKQVVYSLATQDAAIPLTPAEVVEGVRFFRVDVSGRRTG